ncbi:MAG TPA: flagellar filament capping protein FliD [Granulicella sp.]
MGTVGLSFGSATSGQGFDVASTVSAIQAIEQGIETPWKTQLSNLQAQDTVFSSLGTDLSSLTTALQSLTDFSGAMAQKDGASSDPSLLALTGADSTATSGTHTVIINSLAQNSSDYSGAVASTDTLSGSITIQVGSGTAQTITVDSSSNTVSTLAAAINRADIGVTASVISDASGSRLSLVSGTNGAAGQLTITSGLTDATTTSSMSFTVGQTGKDASLSVDGISLTSASNTVTNAIPGVTFQMLGSNVDEPIQVQITNDTSTIASAFSTFVSAYNKVWSDIATQEGNDANGNPEPLYGSPVLASMQSALSSALFSGSASGGISNMEQLGITVNTDGSLSLDTDTLQSVLNSNFSDVEGFLQNTGSFGQSFMTTLNGLGTQAPSGALYLAEQQNQTVESNLNQNISNEESILATQKTQLTAELNSANQILQGIPSQLNEINEIYSAITGYNSQQNG